jgi:hypothetical protein
MTLLLMAVAIIHIEHYQKTMKINALKTDILILHSQLAGANLHGENGWNRYELANRRALASDNQVMNLMIKGK